jgi:hypothetical protein
MLPLPLQVLIVMVAHAINERMARRIDYLQEEVRVLKEALAPANTNADADGIRCRSRLGGLLNHYHRDAA